jgi:hypothetical protein
MGKRRYQLFSDLFDQILLKLSGTALPLLFCGKGAFKQVLTSVIPAVTTSFLLSLFRWISYLVQPDCSVIATVLVPSGQSYSVAQSPIHCFMVW